ncbi:hypothetical protein PG999_009011 [Apiospora kogelbergensis]|uniref:Uncharacterized protein n=1 Tax=Apiospora kogelbergensis TaxID=1337665 RepID=A0AAW0QJF1_9PEZI
MLLSGYSALVALGLVTLSAAFRLEQWTGDLNGVPFRETAGAPEKKTCSRKDKGEMDERLFWANTGCQKGGGGQDQSVKIHAGDGDDALVTVFFSSDDCNPDKIIATVDENSYFNNLEKGCWSGKYGSFEVWSICEDGGLSCMGQP